MSVFVCASWQSWEGSEFWKKWCSLLCHLNSKKIVKVKHCLKNYNVLSYPKMSYVTNCYLKAFNFFPLHDSTHVCGVANVICVSNLIYYFLYWGLAHSFQGSADIFFFFLTFFFGLGYRWLTGFCSDSDCKESACNAGDLGSIPVLGRSPGGGHDNPLQYSCLRNPMDRGAWQAQSLGLQRVRQGWATRHLADQQCCDILRQTSKGLNQSYTYIHPPTPLHPGCHIILSRVPCAL